jgi:hypothetical protein
MVENPVSVTNFMDALLSGAQSYSVVYTECEEHVSDFDFSFFLGFSSI